MRVEPAEVRAVVSKLREWGVYIRSDVETDLVAEFDTRDGIDDNRLGKFSRDSITSRKAALEVLPRTGTQRRMVYDVISFCGSHGATRSEIASTTKLSPNSIRPRVVELLEGGHVEVLKSVTRKNKHRRDEEVLIARKT